MNTPSSNAHITYRPDIDGLRAIAVVSVLIFHTFPTLLPGGFIGVDIFFVISGYLISSILLRDLTNNRFSIKQFYLRRIRRIYPALLIVLLSCFMIGWFFLVADDFKQLSKHIAGGAFFVSNLMLIQEAGYFDTASSTKPLLHLWSLGIEEQFYLIWPPILCLLWRFKTKLGLMVSTLLLLSLGYNLLLINTDLTAIYFSPLSRAWELLAGGLLGGSQSNSKQA